MRQLYNRHYLNNSYIFSISVKKREIEEKQFMTIFISYKYSLGKKGNTHYLYTFHKSEPITTSYRS